MRKKAFLRIGSGVVTLAFSISLAAPAGAFYIEVPKSVTESFTKLKMLAQEGQMMPQQPQPQGTLGQFQPMPSQTDPNMGMNRVAPTQPMQPQQDQSFRPMDQQGQSDQNQMDQQRQQQDQQRKQQEQQSQQQDQQRYLKDMQRNVKQMENNLKQFEKQMKANEKKGQALTPELQEKLSSIKSKVETIKNAKSGEELQDFDMGELNGSMQELEQARQEAEQQQRQMQDVQRNMKNAQQGLTQFERQVNALAKKKVAIPTELKEMLQKIKDIFAAVKIAKSWDEMEAAGIEDLQDLMMSLDEYRQQLEMLSRWPQTEKQLNQQIKNLDTQYKKSQSIVTKLAKKSIDLSAELAAFKEGIDKIKAVRADAVAKMKSGTSEDIQAAFDLLESDFYGQMDDVIQYQNIIMTMSNLGQFQSQFKQRVKQAQTTIRKLKSQKIDTADLAVALNELNVKGNEILAMLKVKPVDQEAIMDALQELEGLGSEFENLVIEAGGEGQDMPWEQGTPQIQSPMQSFSAVQKLLPQKSIETAPASDQTCNINGVEVPGTCESLGATQ